jgi:hypothetical protein
MQVAQPVAISIHEGLNAQALRINNSVYLPLHVLPQVKPMMPFEAAIYEVGADTDTTPTLTTLIPKETWNCYDVVRCEVSVNGDKEMVSTSLLFGPCDCGLPCIVKYVWSNCSGSYQLIEEPCRIIAKGLIDGYAYSSLSRNDTFSADVVAYVLDLKAYAGMSGATVFDEELNILGFVHATSDAHANNAFFLRCKHH